MNSDLGWQEIVRRVLALVIAGLTCIGVVGLLFHSLYERYGQAALFIVVWMLLISWAVHVLWEIFE